MRHFLQPKTRTKYIILSVCLLLTAASLTQYFFTPTYGARLGYRQLMLSNGLAGSNDEYELSFNLSTAGTLGSVVAQFCSNDPLVRTSCTAPGGFDVSQAILTSQTGPGGFSIGSGSTSNQLILTRPPASVVPGTVSFHFTSVHNPSSPGPYFVRLQTFASTDGSGPVSDDGGIAFLIMNNISVTAEVPPYLVFCTGVTITGFNCVNASGDYIDFGELSPAQTRHGSSQMLVATNAQDGYNVSVDGTTLTSGNNVISAITGGDVSRPGTPQFGFNLRANSTPAEGNNPTGPGTGMPQAAYFQPNSYRFVPGDTLITNAKPDDVRLFTASYIANVPKAQAPGIYVSTLTYICLATF